VARCDRHACRKLESGQLHRHPAVPLMPLTVVITRDVEDRYRGLLGSAMLELAPGVYAQPRMSAGVRGRIWAVVEE
jgi:hypothetical protein